MRLNENAAIAIATPFLDSITNSDKYDPAMKIKDQDEARVWFERCVEHCMRVRPCEREEAEEIERGNLGYWAGYYSADTRERVERLFNCSHPVFGSIAAKGQPTAKEAFLAGLERGRSAREKTA